MKLRVRSLMIGVVLVALTIWWSGASSRRTTQLQRVRFHEKCVKDAEQLLKVEKDSTLRAWYAALSRHHREESERHQWFADRPWYRGSYACPLEPLPPMSLGLPPVVGNPPDGAAALGAAIDQTILPDAGRMNPDRVPALPN